MVDYLLCSAQHNCLVLQATSNSPLRTPLPHRTLRYDCRSASEVCDNRFLSQASIDDAANVKNTPANEWTPLHQAARDGDIEQVKVITQ